MHVQVFSHWMDDEKVVYQSYVTKKQRNVNNLDPLSPSIDQPNPQTYSCITTYSFLSFQYLCALHPQLFLNIVETQDNTFENNN